MGLDDLDVPNPRSLNSITLRKNTPYWHPKNPNAADFIIDARRRAIRSRKRTPKRFGFLESQAPGLGVVGVDINTDEALVHSECDVAQPGPFPRPMVNLLVIRPPSLMPRVALGRRVFCARRKR
jgi:hypothetical protein